MLRTTHNHPGGRCRWALVAGRVVGAVGGLALPSHRRRRKKLSPCLWGNPETSESFRKDTACRAERPRSFPTKMLSSLQNNLTSVCFRTRRDSVSEGELYFPRSREHSDGILSVIGIPRLFLRVLSCQGGLRGLVPINWGTSLAPQPAHGKGSGIPGKKLFVAEAPRPFKTIHNHRKV